MKHLTSRWWRKLSNLMGNANLYRLLSRKKEVVVIQVSPFFASGQSDVFPHDGFASFIRKDQILRDPLHYHGRSIRQLCGCAMDHKRRAGARYSALRPKVGDYSYGSEGAYVVDCQPYWERPQEIVQADPISNGTA